MTDDSKFIEYLKSNGFQIVFEKGQGLFRYVKLKSNDCEVFIGHDAEVRGRQISYFHLYDNGRVRKRIERMDDGYKHTVLMWEVPLDNFDEAIQGKLKPIE